MGTTSAVETVTISDTVTTPLVLSTLTGSGDFALAVAASCAIDVTFTPAAQGTRLGSVTINDNARINQQMVSLLGTGI